MEANFGPKDCVGGSITVNIGKKGLVNWLFCLVRVEGRCASAALHWGKMFQVLVQEQQNLMSLNAFKRRRKRINHLPLPEKEPCFSITDFGSPCFAHGMSCSYHPTPPTALNDF